MLIQLKSRLRLIKVIALMATLFISGLISFPAQAHQVSLIVVNTELSIQGNKVQLKTTEPFSYDPNSGNRADNIKWAVGYLNDNFKIKNKEADCIVQVTDFLPQDQNSSFILGNYTCPQPITTVGDLTITSSLFQSFSTADWTNFVKLKAGDKAYDIVFNSASNVFKGNSLAAPTKDTAVKDNNEPVSLVKTVTSSQPIVAAENSTSQAAFFSVLKEFLRLGIVHIFTGTDHILFVIALILVISSFKDILFLTSSFTIAHSLTLILAALGMITVTSRIVKPLIAFSIIFMAVRDFIIFSKNKEDKFKAKKRLPLTFGFGLFHGLGFASALADVHIPTQFFIPALLTFNLGIEAGQLVIVSLIFPWLVLMKKKQWKFRQPVLQFFSIIIAIIATFWFIQRL